MMKFSFITTVSTLTHSVAWHIIGPWAYFTVSDVFNMNYSPQRDTALEWRPLFSESALFAPNFTAGQAEVQ